MISNTLRVCTAALLVLLALACHRNPSTSDITIEYKIGPQPARVGLATIDLKLTKKNGEALSGARVELEGNMSHPGMSPVSGEAREIAPGSYQGTLHLTMAGDWIILVHITLADGQRLQRELELKAVKP